MKNEFIKYKEALALKELGFDEPCFNQYTDGTLDLPCTKYDYPSCVESISAPLYQQAFRWFREKYNFVFKIVFYGKLKGYYYSITEEGWIKYYESIDDAKWYDTYEEAELACLRKLIEIINQNK
jgi:hypothetical protein